MKQPLQLLNNNIYVVERSYKAENIAKYNMVASTIPPFDFHSLVKDALAYGINEIRKARQEMRDKYPKTFPSSI